MKKILCILFITPVLFVTSCGKEENSDYLPILCRGNTSSIPEQQIYIPNVFTPDGNSVNDRFKPSIQGGEQYNYSFIVYNNNGVEVFNTNSIGDSWRGDFNNEIGQPCEEGQYIYSIIYNGYHLQGEVSLIRVLNPELQGYAEVFLNFPEGIQYCSFGDEIDAYNGFIYPIVEHIDLWAPTQTITVEEYPCLAKITVVDANDEPISGCKVVTYIDEDTSHTVYREGLTDNFGKCIFSYKNVAIINVRAEFPEGDSGGLSDEDEMTLVYGETVSTTIKVQ